MPSLSSALHLQATCWRAGSQRGAGTMPGCCLCSACTTRWGPRLLRRLAMGVQLQLLLSFATSLSLQCKRWRMKLRSGVTRVHCLFELHSLKNAGC